MILKRFLRFLTSARLTIGLLCLLALLFLLGVLLPQASVLGEESYAELIERSGPGARFFLETLGFGRMATSPIFLAAVGLFMLVLAAVLLARFGPTLRRVRLHSRSEKGLRAWARVEETYSGPLPPDWSAGHVVRVLRGFGYQVRRPGKSTFWAVKHRTAPLGFLLFHLSFFLLLAGGVLIYYTRFVGTATVSEGQEFAGGYGSVLRVPPLGGPPPLRFTLEEVEARLERGEPVLLAARLRFGQAGRGVVRGTRVNHPARWGSARILVEQAGLAPVLWLQDARGFTLDRVVAPVRTREFVPTDVPLAEEDWKVRVFPLRPGSPFPDRAGLATVQVEVELLRAGERLFGGALRPGEAAAFEGGRLVLEELRYWAGFRVVAERGGGLLIAGFVLGVVGLVWRLLWYRREIALTWEEGVYRLVGRSEFFSAPFEKELASLARMLTRGDAVSDRPASAAERGG